MRLELAPVFVRPSQSIELSSLAYWCMELCCNINLLSSPTHGVARNPRGLDIWPFPPHVWATGKTQNKQVLVPSITAATPRWLRICLIMIRHLNQDLGDVRTCLEILKTHV
ncbi:hypothetical protein CY34DRAFT_808835 [Suillus luteus UH-Slu-Lm8-n1]|uniref:Uncharacterized protein n=1 Tax=Suillus luteus UH-Slu-Lm8-n1 TaxID=930992 RepID=A0A0D0AX56_9AGAM|nr:hypothetical protein CY34DRAFT_808835 [Suillus luteus UH-Slu-Lm8-n1]